MTFQWYVVDGFGNVIAGPMDKYSADAYAKSDPSFAVVGK